LQRKIVVMRCLIAFFFAVTLLSAETRVRIETTLGVIVVSLDERAAPRTVANFLGYIDAGKYNGGRFHRTVTIAPDNQPANLVKIEVIQAGPAEGQTPFPPIPLERTTITGVKHIDGAISMARDGPDTATGDFFICIGAQPELDFGGKRNPDGQGFAAFGRVLSGMEIVKRIQIAPAGGQKLTPPVTIRKVERLR
jgi:peptidyl-prolyl cis-trans isomerase A (cyclophilin A)